MIEDVHAHREDIVGAGRSAPYDPRKDKEVVMLVLVQELGIKQQAATTARVTHPFEDRRARVVWVALEQIMLNHLRGAYSSVHIVPMVLAPWSRNFQHNDINV